MAISQQVPGTSYKNADRRRNCNVRYQILSEQAQPAVPAREQAGVSHHRELLCQYLPVCLITCKHARLQNAIEPTVEHRVPTCDIKEQNIKRNKHAKLQNAIKTKWGEGFRAPKRDNTKRSKSE